MVADPITAAQVGLALLEILAERADHLHSRLFELGFQTAGQDAFSGMFASVDALGVRKTCEMACDISREADVLRLLVADMVAEMRPLVEHVSGQNEVALRKACGATLQ